MPHLCRCVLVTVTLAACAPAIAKNADSVRPAVRTVHASRTGRQSIIISEGGSFARARAGSNTAVRENFDETFAEWDPVGDAVWGALLRDRGRHGALLRSENKHQAYEALDGAGSPDFPLTDSRGAPGGGNWDQNRRVYEIILRRMREDREATRGEWFRGTPTSEEAPWLSSIPVSRRSAESRQPLSWPQSVPYSLGASSGRMLGGSFVTRSTCDDEGCYAVTPERTATSSVISSAAGSTLTDDKTAERSGGSYTSALQPYFPGQRSGMVSLSAASS
jgi:hypothetical protein